MSSMIRGLTLILLAIPLVFFAVALIGTSILVGPAVLVVTMYSWVRVRLRFCPTMFVVRHDLLEIIWPLKRRQIERINITGYAQSTMRNCGARSDGVFAWELADYGADSVGCGRSGVGLFKCTFRVPVTSFGSRLTMGGLGSSRQNIPRPLSEPCRANQMQSPNDQPSRSAKGILLAGAPHAGKASEIGGQTRRVQRGGNPICPGRAFLACLALHELRPLADSFSILLEVEAGNAQQGLWIDPHPVPPWEQRKRKEWRYFTREFGAAAPHAAGTLRGN